MKTYFWSTNVVKALWRVVDLQNLQPFFHHYNIPRRAESRDRVRVIERTNRKLAETLQKPIIKSTTNEVWIILCREIRAYCKDLGGYTKPWEPSPASVRMIEELYGMERKGEKID